jgi:hypothetical protein
MPLWARAAFALAALVMFLPEAEIQFGAILLSAALFFGLKKRMALRIA